MYSRIFYNFFLLFFLFRSPSNRSHLDTLRVIMHRTTRARRHIDAKRIGYRMQSIRVRFTQTIQVHNIILLYRVCPLFVVRGSQL